MKLIFNHNKNSILYKYLHLDNLLGLWVMYMILMVYFINTYLCNSFLIFFKEVQRVEKRHAINQINVRFNISYTW